MHYSHFPNIVKSAMELKLKIGYELNTGLMLPGAVDEMSVLFHNAWDQEEFAKWTKGQDGIEHYQDDAQVFMKVLDYETIKERRAYAYHARFNFFHMEGGWRIQTQSLWTVNPVKPYKDPMFQGFADGSVVHASWKVDSLDAWLEVAPGSLQVLGRFETAHGSSLYIGTANNMPLLHPRSPKIP